MRTKLIYVIFLTLSSIAFSSCDNGDELQKSAPVVSIDPVKDITATSATLSGKVVDKGNDEITEAGFVYSSNVALPTVADTKVVSTLSDNTFTSNLSNLSSGTTYHVRAFATNGVSTAYTDVLDFSTGNLAPVVTNVTIEGTLEVNKTISAKYSYNDSENDSEGASTFQWYVATDAAGNSETAIAGATAKTFLVQEDQNGKYIRVSVFPKASKGTIDGLEVKSSYIGAVGEATTVTFMYNNNSVTYGIISSPTGKKWLDRNLGAEQAATAIDDYKAFGDLFQWGRLADGHQLISWTGQTNAQGTTGITSTTAPFDISSQDVPTTNKFIVIPDGSNSGDWRSPQKDGLWQAADGINNPCPAGWRIPTKDEWLAEGIDTDDSAFAKLKLTHNGARLYKTGEFYSLSAQGQYWSSTPIAKFGKTYSVSLYFGTDTDGSVYTFSDTFSNRAFGMGCRCIKN